MANLSLSHLFGDYAVFPQGKPITVFGACDTAGKVTLTLANGKSYEKDFLPEDGSFSVSLPPVDTYEEDATLTVTAGDAVSTAKHVAIGVVLFASGQSNMQFALKDGVIPNPLRVDKRMRFFIEKHFVNDVGDPLTEPSSDVWFPADGESELSFSSIGYFCADILSRTLSVTVGVIACNQGASRIESWIEPEALQERGIDMTPFADHIEIRNRIFNRAHWLYKNKYLPVCRYPITAVLWYQGESNNDPREGTLYKTLLHTLFANWRAHAGDAALPFYLVELAPFDSVAAWGFAYGDWAPVRASIIEASKEDENVYAVSLTDSDESLNIHPTHKYPVAEKLSCAILASLFGHDVEYTGPVFDRATYTNGVLTVTFTHAAKLGFRDRFGNPEACRDIYCLDANGVRTDLAPVLDGNTMSVTLPQNAVFFDMGYSNAPAHNLRGEKDYLASPFRVDLRTL